MNYLKNLFNGIPLELIGEKVTTVDVEGSDEAALRHHTKTPQEINRTVRELSEKIGRRVQFHPLLSAAKDMLKELGQFYPQTSLEDHGDPVIFFIPNQHIFIRDSVGVTRFIREGDIVTDRIDKNSLTLIENKITIENQLNESLEM